MQHHHLLIGPFDLEHSCVKSSSFTEDLDLGGPRQDIYKGYVDFLDLSDNGLQLFVDFDLLDNDNLRDGGHRSQRSGDGLEKLLICGE